MFVFAKIALKKGKFVNDIYLTGLENRVVLVFLTIGQFTIIKNLISFIYCGLIFECLLN